MTQLSETYKVDLNGVIDTGRTVMQNIENMANSSYAWATFDITTGKWSVIINRPGTSIYSFNEENIVGAVDLSITPLDRLYNAVEIQFPDGTLEDANRMVRAEMLPADLKQNEQENVLRLTYPLVNDQIRALTLGLTELKQSRLDKVVSLTSNYLANGIRAGDIVDITIDTYGWTNKLFRVLQIEEVDTDGGDFNIKFTCIEYSDTVYEHDTEKFTFSDNDGIFGLGDIRAMDPLTVTLTEEDQLPFILLESAFNTAGAPVTGVEIWAYNVTDPTEIANWNNPSLYPDDERAYVLYAVKNAVNDSFEAGSDFENRLYDTGAGNWLIKIRPVNSQTSGPFTVPAALTTYTPNVANGIAPALSDNVLFGDTVMIINNITFQWIAGVPLVNQPLSGTFLARYDTTSVLYELAGNFNSGGALASNAASITVSMAVNGTLLTDTFGSTSHTAYTDSSDGTIALGIQYNGINIQKGDSLTYNLVFNSTYPVNSVTGTLNAKTPASYATIT